ncbi:MAG TPA: hypothetical protein VFK56_07960 [Mycobacterium sp.]|nr:hypothetical protein [Mycobacterium sp.]
MARPTRKCDDRCVTLSMSSPRTLTRLLADAELEKVVDANF